MIPTDPLLYFTKEDQQELEVAPTFVALRDIALRVLKRMPPGVSMICGPISSGGLGSVEKNLERFVRAINLMASRGENVFTQIPFERPMQRIKEDNEGILLETFYRPIFASGRVVRLCFMPDWRTSRGTQWELARAFELGLGRKYFRDDFLTRAIHEAVFKES